ncbi:MAG: Gfo/Idh/MocA family oxidoreductase [Aliiglaciecola sp.]
MSKKVRWGILGLGNIANKFAQDLKLSKNATLVSVASRDLQKAQAFGRKYNAAWCFDSYEALADDPNLDIIYIATPHVFHFENTLMCLRKGKAVLCEKPISMNAEEVVILTEEAKARNLFLMEAMWTRFIPATEKLLSMVRQNEIGEIKHINANFGFASDMDPNGRLLDKSLGGGSLLDVGIYPVFLSILLLGVPLNVQATARMTKTDVDSYCAMLFDYENGAKACLESSIESDTPTEARIYGEKGTIIVHSRFHHAEKLTLSTDGKSKSFDINYIGHGYFHEIEEANKCVLNKRTESTKFPPCESLKLASLLDLVRANIGLSYEHS